MKKMISLLFLMSYAFANESVYDLIRDGKAKYSMGSSCKSFFQKRDLRKYIQSSEIKNLLETPKEVGVDNYFYHYTNSLKPLGLLYYTEKDRKKAQRKIKKQKGYKEIYNYQMTYRGALSNAAGVGFYMAANPFSSADYGDYQILLKVNPKSKVLNTSKHSSTLSNIKSKLRLKVRDLFYCDDDLIDSVIYDENGVDLVYYSTGSQWFVSFNEDIILESKVTRISSTTNYTIVKRMVQDKIFEPLFSYVDIFRPSYSYTISFDDMISYLEVDQDISNLEEFTDYILKSIPVKSNEDLYLNILKNISENSFLKYYNKMAKQSYAFQKGFMDIDLSSAHDKIIKQYARLFNSGLRSNLVKRSVVNIQTLYSKKMLTQSQFQSALSSKIKLSKLYSSYSSSEYSSDIGIIIINDMLVNGKDYYNSLTLDQKYALFNYYIANGKKENISSFISQLEKLSYPLNVSFSWSLSRSIRYNLENLQAFYYEYLRRNKTVISDINTMDQIKSIMIRSKKPNMDILKLIVDSLKTNETIIASYLNSFIDDTAGEFISLVINSKDLYKMKYDSKRKVYFDIMNIYGFNSKEYRKYIQNARVSDLDELKFLDSNFSLSEDTQIRLYKKFKKSSTAMEEFKSFQGKSSFLNFLNSKIIAPKVLNHMLADFKNELFNDLNIFKSIKLKSSVLWNELLKYNYYRSLYSNFSSDFKIYLLKENFITHLKVEETLEMLKKIDFDQKSISDIVEFSLSLNNIQNISMAQIFEATPLILLNAKNEDFIKYFGKISSNYSLLKRHQSIYMNSSLSFNKKKSILLYMENLNAREYKDFVKKQFNYDYLNKEEISLMREYYLANYSKLSLMRSTFWKNHFKANRKDLNLLFNSFSIKSLKDRHLIEVLSFYFYDEDKAEDLDLYLSKKSISLNQIVLETKNRSLISQMAQRLDAKNMKSDHLVDQIMDFYVNNKYKSLKLYVQNRLCKKADRKIPLREWFKRAQDKQEKRLRKSLYKEECR